MLFGGGVGGVGVLKLLEVQGRGPITKSVSQGTWLAPLGEHGTLDLGVMSLNPMLPVEITNK